MNIVVIGNGAAGVTAVQKLREMDKKCSITLISQEKCTAYAKIMLPDYIGNKLTREKIIIRDEDFYSKNNIRLFLNTKVTGIDTNARTILLDDGETIEYDKLLIATGAAAFIPNIKGVHDIEKYTINSIEDAENIKIKSEIKRNILVVGAGLAGLETAFALESIGANVTIVERETKILPTLLDDGGSFYIEEIIKRKGINVVLGRTICEFLKDINSVAVLDNGQKIIFDFAVFTIGTRPELDVFKKAGIDCNRGVLVDDYLKTSIEDVYAAGDVAEIQNKMEGYVSCYIWQNAMEQGKCAAFNILGDKKEYSLKNTTGTMIQLRDIPFISMGLLNPANIEDYGVLEIRDSKFYKKIVMKDDEIKGFVCYGDNKSAYKLMSMLKKSEKVLDKRVLI